MLCRRREGCGVVPEENGIASQKTSTEDGIEGWIEREENICVRRKIPNLTVSRSVCVPPWDAPPEHSHLLIWRVISCLFIRRGSGQCVLRPGPSGFVGVAGHRQYDRESRRAAVTLGSGSQRRSSFEEARSNGSALHPFYKPQVKGGASTGK